MQKITPYIALLLMCFATTIVAQDLPIEDIISDIYHEIADDAEIPFEQLEEDLLNLAQHPINLNQTTFQELSQLPFLNDQQIDAILLHQYRMPYQSIYELQLIDNLDTYDIRNLLPFVYVGPCENTTRLTFTSLFQLGHHELTMRTDLRNLEQVYGDPVYAKLRYRFNSKRLQAGITLTRPTGAPIRDLEHGAYIQLNDIGPFKNIVVGNYQAHFGYGLVVGSPFKRGKTSYIQSTTTAQQGLRKFTSSGEDYNHFHGVGATAHIKWAEITAFYSIRPDKNEDFHHVVGTNLTARYKKLKLSLTAIENIYSNPSSTQAVIGMDARYNWGKVDLWGEVATSQSSQWGWGTIVGTRYTPIENLGLMAIYRYYSPHYNNPYANVLASSAQVNNEQGGYIGIQFDGLKHTSLSAFADVWQDGYETILQADVNPHTDYGFHTRVRAKNKNDLATYSLRFRYSHQLSQWRFHTQLDANLVHPSNQPTSLGYGVSLFQDVEYRFAQIPIVLQFRAQAFDAREWNNRVYMYENDVLYAYSIPFVYGLGARLWLNARYKINDTFSLYLKVSETIYERAWANRHDKANSRTDLHVLLRIKI
jgi:hypothetical protein